jgi:hypothetical protein
MTTETTDLPDLFSDLNWPGKRQPVNRTAEPASSGGPTESGWDENPKRYMVKGVEREFFTISHLSAALGRSAVTIRSWENKGKIPRTPYRSPTPRGNSLPGTTAKGMRLWTREQIDGVLNIAREEGVVLNGKPPTKRFHDKVYALYSSLKERDSQQ